MKDEIKEILDRARNLKNKCSCCEQIADNVYVSRYHEIETQNLAEAVYLIDKLLDCITNLQEKLEVSQTNEETYRLEMEDITKILGLDEYAIFDEVKEYATNLQEELKEYKMLFDAFSKRPYAHRYLEEKKKELGNKNIIGLDSEMIYKDYYDLQEENKQTKLLKEKYQLEKEVYKLKNEKAIEYIHNHQPVFELSNKEQIQEWFEKEYYIDLLNILNGGE